jgi:hypothetical protein
MPVRASRPRGVRGRPRAPDERRALQQVAYRQAVRAFRTRIVREGAIPSRGMVYFAGPASGRLIVYHAQSSSDPAGIGAGSVSPCNFRMDCWLK